MRSFVTFLLLALLGAIAAFLISNTTPIALTFLGITSIALPLAVWMGGAILAGVATGLWFSILFRLAERRGARLESKRQKAASFGPDDFAMVDDGYPARDFATASDYGESRYGEEGYQGAGYEQNAGYDDAAEGYRDYGDRNRDDGQQWKPFQTPNAVRADGAQGDFAERSRPEAFEMVEAEPPVYDANYRVIQPPEPERRSAYEPEPYDSKPYDSKSYGSSSYSSQPYDSRPSYESEDSFRAGDGYNTEPFSSRSDAYRSDTYTSNTDNSKTDGDGPAPDESRDAKPRDAEPRDRDTDSSFYSSGGKSDRAESRPTSQPTSQQESQSKDDWDIDDALDW